jgi:hypothetical protein
MSGLAGSGYNALDNLSVGGYNALDNISESKAYNESPKFTIPAIAALLGYGYFGGGAAGAGGSAGAAQGPFGPMGSGGAGASSGAAQPGYMAALQHLPALLQAGQQQQMQSAPPTLSYPVWPQPPQQQRGLTSMMPPYGRY